MWKLNNNKCWALKNWCLQTVVLKKTLESPLDCKEIKPVNPKVNQPWIFIGRTDAEAPIIWPPNAKNWLTGKEPDAGKDRRQEAKGTKEDEMVGWHHQLNGHEFEQTPRDGGGQGSLACCSPWGRKGWRWLSDWTELRWQVDNSIFVSVQFSTVTQSCPTLCDPMDYSTSGFTVLHHLVEFAQTHVHWVGDAIHHLIPCCPLFHLPSIFPASGSSPLSQMLQSMESQRVI